MERCQGLEEQQEHDGMGRKAGLPLLLLILLLSTMLSRSLVLLLLEDQGSWVRPLLEGLGCLLCLLLQQKQLAAAIPSWNYL